MKPTYPPQAILTTSAARHAEPPAYAGEQMPSLAPAPSQPYLLADRLELGSSEPTPSPQPGRTTTGHTWRLAPARQDGDDSRYWPHPILQGVTCLICSTGANVLFNVVGTSMLGVHHESYTLRDLKQTGGYLCAGGALVSPAAYASWCYHFVVSEEGYDARGLAAALGVEVGLAVAAGALSSAMLLADHSSVMPVAKAAAEQAVGAATIMGGLTVLHILKARATRA